MEPDGLQCLSEDAIDEGEDHVQVLRLRCGRCKA
jgi:hypothetical protein